MPIIKFTRSNNPETFAALNLYPNQYVSTVEKEKNDWIKENMDYFYSVALRNYIANKNKLQKNYELYKGILKREDFYEEPVTQSFTDTLLKNEDLPGYVKHYSILTPPVNTLVGEMSKRPDNIFVKDFSEDGINEERAYQEEVLKQLAVDTIKGIVSMQASMNGQELSEEDLDAMTAERASDMLSSFTSQAEKWGAKMVEYLKVRLALKDKSEEAFRDLLISAREFFHIYEDNSQIGFNVEILNPIEVWQLSTQDTRYTSDPLNDGVGVYAAGIVNIMELSEIIHKFKLTKEEIEHLREMSQQGYQITSKRSTLLDSSVTGPDSVQYNNYDRAVLEYRLLAESSLMNNNRDELSSLLGITTNVGVFGNKYLVVRAYWKSKKKVGKLTYIDEDGVETTIPVDENYKKGSHPQEISLEWGWVNQWYQGIRIGWDVYYVKPLEILDYCPIIGCFYEPKNIKEPVSLVDQMKPFQMLYNVAMNKLFRLLEKDLGVVFLSSIRHIPVPKDGDYKDAIDMWEAEARERGIIFVDDSPENLKAPSSFNQFNAVNLSRSNEIQAYYQLAIEMRNECWKLVGLSEQRLGESKATETATAINTSLTQSYAQTEPWFTQHNYVLNKVAQALLDTAIHIAVQKPESVIPYMSDEGDRAMIQMTTKELPFRDLGVLITDRAQDAQNYQELKLLAQAMLQNGATPYEIALMYSTKSVRKMTEAFKKIKEKQEQFQEQQMQIEQAKVEQAERQAQQANQLMQLQQEKQLAFEAYQKEQDRLSKEKIAYIQAASKESGGTVDSSMLDYSRFENEQTKINNDYQFKLADIAQKQQQILAQNMQTAQKMQLDREKLQIERENMANDLQIARMQAKAKAKQASKSKTKK